jgi:anti-sigma regulatory factor (Ser/Thr protein kinase)
MAGMSQGFHFAADDPPVAGCAKLVAEYDWSDSEFGPRDTWGPAVETVVRTLIEASAPMAYCHGPGQAMAYNDRFADLLGTRHPRAWGQRASLVMPEVWSRPGYAEAVDNVFAGGPSFHDEGEMLDLNERDQSHPDWAYLARSYSAVRDSNGSVLGILIVVVEIAPVLVLVSGPDHGDQGAPRWRGMERWDETVARQPLVWSGFRAGKRPHEAVASDPDQRFVAEAPGELVLPINGPDIGGSIGYLGAPRHLPDVQMVTLAARDQNDTPETASSGEFYDVFDMPDGRLAVTIGEVTGAGIVSSAIMAQVKVSLRGAALSSSDPTVIFNALDELVSHLDRTWPAVHGRDVESGVSREAVRAGFGGELYVTALLGIFDPATGDLQLASAGHFPPAVVRRPSTQEAQAGSGPLAEYAAVEPGPPLGIGGTRPVTRLVLHRGDVLVGYTDGLLNRRAEGLPQRQSALLETLSSMSATEPRSISQHVVDTLIGDTALEHGCALLVVVRDSRAHQMTSVLIPPHTIAVRGARRWARAQLESWGVDSNAVSDVVLCVSELVTNVVQHAGTPARVTLELADRLLVTVEDTGTWSAPQTRQEDPNAMGGRGLALVAALSAAMGHSRGVDGSTVWFEVALDRESASVS